MIPMPSGVRVWIAAGHTDMRRGMQGLALQVQEQLKRDPALRRSLHFPGSQRRPGEDPLARWPGAIAVCEAARPGEVHLAFGEGGRRFDLGRADGLHARRDRLAESATNVAAEERGLMGRAEPREAKKNMGSDAF